MSKVPRLLTATLLGSLLGCIIISCIMMSTLVVADDKEFRCFRPFSSLNSFSPSSMHATENCMFGPLLVKDAKAVATCASDGCKVKVELVEGQRLRVATQDRMRYTLEIKAVNDSAINYKGFDNRGYSMCCMFLDDSACEWREVEERSPATIEKEEEKEAAPAETYEDPDPLGLGIKQKKARSKKAEETETKKDTPTPKQQVVVKCPLQDRADGEPVAASMSGSITKPLHVYKAGKWEVNLMLWYGGAATNDPLTNDDMVGRLKLPFELTEEQVAKVGGSWNQEEDIEKKADSSSTTAATTTTTTGNLPPLDGTDDTSAPMDSGLGLVTVKKRSKDDEGEPEKKVGGAEL